MVPQELVGTGDKSFILPSHSLQNWVLKRELQQVGTLSRSFKNVFTLWRLCGVRECVFSMKPLCICHFYKPQKRVCWRNTVTALTVPFTAIESKVSRESLLSAVSKAWRILWHKHGACHLTLNHCEWISLCRHEDLCTWRPDDPAVSHWHNITENMLLEVWHRH